MKYFKHDSDAAQDAKLRRLRLKYGMEGYGVYWFILELIARNVDRHNLTFELEHDAELIAADTGIHHERVEEQMRYMVELGLFENVNGIIRCLKMAGRADEYTQKLILSARPKTNVTTVSRQCPDTLATKSELREEKRTEENRREILVPNGTSDLRKRKSPVPVAEIVALYHEILCPPLPTVGKITKTREGFVRQRWAEDLPTLDHWRNYFAYVAQSAFLCGKAMPKNGSRPFLADFEWLCRPGNFAKVSEEKYHG